MSFFGGTLKHEYWVMEHQADQGWLIMVSPDGKGLWLMSTKPVLPAGATATALARVKQLGYDVGKLEFPAQPRR